MTLSVLSAGDHFVLPELFSGEVERRFGAGDVEVAELRLPWPDTPFASIGGVDEASGSEELIVEHLRGRQAILTQLAPITDRVLDASPELRFIGVSRGGPVNIDLDAAARRGVTVCNVPGRNSVATAEMSLALMLAVLRGVPSAQRGLEESRWEGDLYRFDRVGTEIAGSTVGLLGLGAVGERVARAVQALGARVLIFDPYLPEDRRPAEYGFVDDADELFRESDIVSVHARLTEESRGIVSVARLGLMRRGSFLVNAARGGLVDYAGVAAALESGRLGGAAFDVYPREPVDFSQPIFESLRAGRNVVVTPHIAGASKQTAVRAAAGVADELWRFHTGAPLRHALV